LRNVVLNSSERKPETFFCFVFALPDTWLPTGCCMWPGLLPAACCLLPAACCICINICRLPPSACCLLPAACCYLLCFWACSCVVELSRAVEGVPICTEPVEMPPAASAAAEAAGGSAAGVGPQAAAAAAAGGAAPAVASPSAAAATVRESGKRFFVLRQETCSL
jgi:hypothetical protein